MKNLFITLVLITLTSCASKKAIKPIEPPKPVDVITYRSSLNYIKELAKKTNCTLSKVEFQKEVSEILEFDLDPTHSTGAKVISDLISKKCIISTYRTKWPWSKAIAMAWTNEKEPIVYFNTRKNPRKMDSMINTAVHECLHKHGYSHGSNSPAGKEKTVPYWVGEIAQRHACE